MLYETSGYVWLKLAEFLNFSIRRDQQGGSVERHANQKGIDSAVLTEYGGRQRPSRRDSCQNQMIARWCSRSRSPVRPWFPPQAARSDLVDEHELNDVS